MHHHHCQTKDWNSSVLRSIADLQYNYCSSICVSAVSTNVKAQVVSAVNTVQYLNLYRQAIIDVESIVADGAAHRKSLLEACLGHNSHLLPHEVPYMLRASSNPAR